MRKWNDLQSLASSDKEKCPQKHLNYQVLHGSFMFNTAPAH